MYLVLLLAVMLIIMVILTRTDYVTLDNDYVTFKNKFVLIYFILTTILTMYVIFVFIIQILTLVVGYWLWDITIKYLT